MPVSLLSELDSLVAGPQLIESFDIIETLRKSTTCWGLRSTVRNDEESSLFNILGKGYVFAYGSKQAKYSIQPLPPYQAATPVWDKMT